MFFSNNFKEVKTIAKQDLFINDEIRVREVRLIGLEGEQLGIKPLSEAQALADDANVDLVLIQVRSLGIDSTDSVNSKSHVVSHGYLAIQIL